MRAAIFLLWISVAAACAQAADIAGSADHPLLPRYEGADIVRYKTESFADYSLRTAKTTGPDSALELEGKLTRITYRGPEERAVLEVFRNYEQALAEAGFAPLFSCAKQECGDIPRHIEKGELYMTLWGGGDHRYLAGRLQRAEGDVYVSLYITKNHGGGPARGRAMVQLDLLELEPMQQRMAVVEADALGRDLAAEGRVAVYGILFDTDKHQPRADSKAQLDEIGKLLSADPGLKVLVVGHTDNQGAYDYNRELSRRRAASVVAALARDYGIASDRLTAVGVGMAAPVDSNRSADGRERNRRVELVER